MRKRSLLITGYRGDPWEVFRTGLDRVEEVEKIHDEGFRRWSWFDGEMRAGVAKFPPETERGESSETAQSK